MSKILAVIGVVVSMVSGSPAVAQRLPFAWTREVPPDAALDVTTDRGKIDIVAGAAGRIVVTGDVTVRLGWDVPAAALDLARQVAAQPPIALTGSVVTLSDPVDAAARRAVTVRYRVEVPPETKVVSSSQSGETTIGQVRGCVDARTQSGAITLTNLGGGAAVHSGSGAVMVSDIAGNLDMETASSAVTATGVAGNLRVRTGSGAVRAALTGAGLVDVESQSSALMLDGVRGSLRARSGSGHVTVNGAPGDAWDVTAGSGGVTLTFAADAHATIDASSRSGSVVVTGLSLEGQASKQSVSARLAGGGPAVRVSARSGTIRLAGGADAP
jgi:hypothetical protein